MSYTRPVSFPSSTDGSQNVYITRPFVSWLMLMRDFVQRFVLRRIDTKLQIPSWVLKDPLVVYLHLDKYLVSKKRKRRPKICQASLILLPTVAPNSVDHLTVVAL